MSSKTKITTTKEEAKPALVPKLRFPDFHEAAGWEQTTLGTAARLKNGYAFKSADYVDSGPFQIVTIANVQQGSLTLEAAKRIAQPPADIQTHQKLRIGDILISMTGNVGRICRVTCDSLLLNQRVGKLMPEEIDPEFFYHSLQRDEFRNAMQLKAVGGAQGNLSSGDITDYPLHRPTDEAEQQKIAECLSSVDELMAAQARKVAALKTHKKGLMQQLFPREGETQPRLRFPEFQNDGEWVDDTLGAVCELYQPVTLSSSELSMTGEHLVYGANGVIGTHNEYNHEESEIAVTCRGATCGEVTITKPKSWVTGNAMIVKPRTKKLRKDFIFQYLKNHGLKAIISGSAQPQITRTGFAPLLVFFPQPDEQQRIADCLTSLDDLIAAQTQKHEALKTHKKGLMQQLFPAPTISTS